MAAVTQPVNITTFKAGGTIRKFRFVALSANGTVTECGANGRAIGIHQGNESVSSGEFLDVALPGGGAKLEVGEACAVGKLLTSTAAGKGEIADAAGEYIGAIAFEAGGADGDVIGVRVVSNHAHASDA